MTAFLTILENLWKMATVLCALRSASEALYNVGKVARLLSDLEIRVTRMENGDHESEQKARYAEGA